MKLTSDQCVKIQEDGATARAEGMSSRLQNPFYKSENMPKITGESVEAWREKVFSWRLGYEQEDKMRS